MCGTCAKEATKTAPPSDGKAKVKLYKHLVNIIEFECTDGLLDAVLKITIAPPPEKQGRRWRWVERGQSV